MSVYRSLGGDETHEWVKSIVSNYGDIDTAPALGPDEIAVLGLPYGGPEAGRDASGQWFSPMTEFYDGVIDKPAVFYTHGAENGFEPELVGTVTGSWYDKAGKWFKVSLENSSRYAQLVEAHQTNVLRASSGAVPASVTVNPLTGHVDSWLVGELSLVDLRDGYKPVNAYAITKAMPDVLFEDNYDEPVEELSFDTNGLIILLRTLLNTLTGNTVPFVPVAGVIKAEPETQVEPVVDDKPDQKAEDVTVSDSTRCLPCEEAQREADALKAEIEAETSKCQMCPDAIRWTRTMFKAAKITPEEAFGFIERFTKSDEGFETVKAEVEARTVVPSTMKAFMAGGQPDPERQPAGVDDTFVDPKFIDSQLAMHKPGYQKKF